MISPEEFRDKMAKIFSHDGYDREKAHGDADSLMCIVLNDLGYGDGVSIFEAADIWYA